MTELVIFEVYFYNSRMSLGTFAPYAMNERFLRFPLWYIKSKIHEGILAPVTFDGTNLLQNMSAPLQPCTFT